MRRRLFLQFPLVVSSLTAAVQAAAAQGSTTQEQPKPGKGFRVGEETFNLKPGDSAFAPRKIAHAFAKTSEGEAQMMVLFQPAGMMEDFFLEMSKTGKGILKDEQVMRKLWQTHGMEIVGPPLKF
jgi:hypothetical protein